MKKVWKPIENTKGYMVSNEGEIRNSYGKPVRSYIGSGAQRVVSIYTASGKLTTRILRVIILEAFVGPRPKGCSPHHKDNNLGNFRADNLEWVFKQPNSGPNDFMATMYWDTIRNLMIDAEVDSMSNQQLIKFYKDLAEQYQTDVMTICLIHMGRSWKRFYKMFIKPNL